MNKSNPPCKDIDEYHSFCPAGIRKILDRLRRAIKQAAPKATETISYGMPAFRQKRVLVYYAAHKEHIGFYPTPKPIVHFKEELEKYSSSKGAIQFPIDKSLPLSLIRKIVKFRVAEVSDNPKSRKGIKTRRIIVNKDIRSYHMKQNATDRSICERLLREICSALPDAENKVWHGHPVWFLDGNPIVGYSKQQRGMRLLFWSGASFDEQGLEVRGRKFKDASVFYHSVSDIVTKDLKRWLKKSKTIQWDYKNIVKRKGLLERLK